MVKVALKKNLYISGQKHMRLNMPDAPYELNAAFDKDGEMHPGGTGAATFHWFERRLCCCTRKWWWRRRRRRRDGGPPHATTAASYLSPLAYVGAQARHQLCTQSRASSVRAAVGLYGGRTRGRRRRRTRGRRGPRGPVRRPQPRTLA